MSNVELWKSLITVPTFEKYNNYHVTTYGNVKSYFNIKLPRLLTPSMDHRGYMTVNLYGNDDTKKLYYVHRIVAYAFLSTPPQANMDVNHKDCDRRNNCILNLEWVTRKENNIHAIRVGCHGLGAAKIFGDSFREAIRMRKQGSTQKEIAAYFNVDQSTISRLFRERKFIG